MPRLIDVAAGRACVVPFVFDATPARHQRKRSQRHFPGVKFTARELAEIRAAYGPFLSLERAAEVAGLAPTTLKKQVCEGRYANCVKRGKPIRFLTERFVQEMFAGTRQ